MLVWGPNINGKFSVKSTIWIQKGTLTQSTKHKLINKMLKLNIPPKVKMFAWLFICERLQTRKRLSHIVINSDKMCPFCNFVDEDQKHLFLIVVSLN